MRERRLAITIKGAISLGAYEAGAIAETLRLIAYNNTRTDPAKIMWYVDAACGASAGSMTSAMVAAALVRGDTDVLRRTWVTGVSLGMLAPENQKLSSNNILDAGSLDVLASENLTFPTSANRHPAMRPPPDDVTLSSEVRLRFTLSRFAPDVITQDTLNQTKLSFNEYKDSADFTIGLRNVAQAPVAVDIAATGVASAGYHNASESLKGSDAWSALVQTAIASGSFPFAFAPRDLRRWVNGAWMDRYFQDGGTFDNDPIGETINIAHDIDWSGKREARDWADTDRRFMMIHVEPFQGLAPETIPNAPITREVNPLILAGKYFPAIMEESENSGLSGIVVVNRKIAERSKFLGELAELVRVNGAQALPRPLLNALAKYRDLDGRVDFFRDHIIPDLAQTDPKIFAEVDMFPDAQKEAFKDLALAYDLAVNLTDKTTLTPILIAPAQRLAGSGLYAFGGFLVSRLRERDYAQGVYDAYQAWKAVAETQRDFLLDTTSAPDLPETVEQLFPQCKDEYQEGIVRMIERVEAVIGALSEAAAGSGLAGTIEAKVLGSVLDAAAKHFLNKAASGP